MSSQLWSSVASVSLWHSPSMGRRSIAVSSCRMSHRKATLSQSPWVGINPSAIILSKVFGETPT